MIQDDLHVTFVIPTFNRASLIGECLRSILGQTGDDWSIVVIDDASTDGTQELIASLSIPNLLLLANPHQLGAAESRNRGIAAAQNGLVAFIDSDDRLHAQHVSRVRETFSRNPSADVVCCDSRIIDEHGEALWAGDSFQRREARRKRYHLQQGMRGFEDVFVFSTSFPGTSIRKRALARVGGFDQAYFPLEDVDLQLRLCAAGAGVFYLDEVLADYRTHAGSVSAGMGRAVGTCAKKVQCLAAWIPRRPSGVRVEPLRRRLADAYLELAIASWKAGQRARAMTALAEAVREGPRVVWKFFVWRIQGTHTG